MARLLAGFEGDELKVRSQLTRIKLVVGKEGMVRNYPSSKFFRLARRACLNEPVENKGSLKPQKLPRNVSAMVVFKI